MKRIDTQTLRQLLDAVLASDSFELHACGEDYAIPYMMNDAAECVIWLRSCRMQGAWQSGSDTPMQAEYISSPQPGIIFRQGQDNVFSLWYSHAECRLELFRYDQIGHFWVFGHAQWRRMTYMIGTMHDKYQFLGADACNAVERKLLPLIKFRPFRMYSPIPKSLDSRYNDSPEGALLMAKLAHEAGDRWFALLCRLYARWPHPGLTRQLCRHLASSRSIGLYSCLFDKVMFAASAWPSRSYDGIADHEIRTARNAVAARLEQLGFSGSYPLFSRGDIQVLAVEEHPFTEFESDDYLFHIRYMLSISPQHSICAGFFQSPVNYSAVADSLNALEQELTEKSVAPIL